SGTKRVARERELYGRDVVCSAAAVISLEEEPTADSLPSQGEQSVGWYCRSHVRSVSLRGAACTAIEPLRTMLTAPMAWFHVNCSPYATLARAPWMSMQL